MVHADLDGFAFAVSAIASADAVLEAVETRLGKTVSATWQAIDRGTCKANLVATNTGAPTLDLDALRRLASAGFGCAFQVVGLGLPGSWHRSSRSSPLSTLNSSKQPSGQWISSGLSSKVSTARRCHQGTNLLGARVADRLRHSDVITGAQRCGGSDRSDDLRPGDHGDWPESHGWTVSRRRRTQAVWSSNQRIWRLAGSG